MPRPNLHCCIPPALLAAATAQAASQRQTIDAYLAGLIAADLGQPAAAALATLIAAAPLVNGDANGC